MAVTDRRELVAVMRLVLEDIAERRAAEKAERRAKMRVVDGRRRPKDVAA